MFKVVSIARGAKGYVAHTDFASSPFEQLFVFAAIAAAQVYAHPGVVAVAPVAVAHPAVVHTPVIHHGAHSVHS